MISKQDAVVLLEISDKVWTLASQLKDGDLFPNEFTDLIEAQLMIAYELGKDSI